LSASEVEAAKQPHQHQNHEDQTDDAAETWRPPSPVRVVAAATAEQQQQNYDYDNECHRSIA